MKFLQWLLGPAPSEEVNEGWRQICLDCHRHQYYRNEQYRELCLQYGEDIRELPVVPESISGTWQGWYEKHMRPVDKAIREQYLSLIERETAKIEREIAKIREETDKIKEITVRGNHE